MPPVRRASISQEPDPIPVETSYRRDIGGIGEKAGSSLEDTLTAASVFGWLMQLPLGELES